MDRHNEVSIACEQNHEVSSAKVWHKICAISAELDPFKFVAVASTRCPEKRRVCTFVVDNERKLALRSSATECRVSGVPCSG